MSIPGKIDKILMQWSLDQELSGCVYYSDTTPQRPAILKDWPDTIHPGLKQSFVNLGITQLFSHQMASWEAASQRKNFVVVTGTASGKTLCYNLPVLQELISDPNATALFLFPTKALTNDQADELGKICQTIHPHPAVSIYDGDTPTQLRKTVRDQSRILLTNPDMLHTGILPHHTLWSRFFEGLRFIIIDEMHTYRGVFGSHICNLLRRVKRVAAFYGGFPQFILTSATIGNPAELAEKLIEQPVELVDQDGAWKGEKHFVIVNPPVVDVDLGIRKSAFSQCMDLSDNLIQSKIQTLVFVRSRKTVEQFIRELRIRLPAHQEKIRGYRSGYLSRDRRETEEALRSGTAELVAATNALELGIDIGGLSAILMMGYPGTIAATRQQAGRAGRKDEPSLSVFVASASPIDQFLARHPEYLTGRSPEQALIDPDNFLILLNHIQCAAFELPMNKGEKFGSLSPQLLLDFLNYLLQSGALVEKGDKYFWMSDQYPASRISLRSASSDVIALQTIENGHPRVIGEVDYASALWMVHPGAIYLHDGESYEVEDLNLERKTAQMQMRPSDFYTEPIISTTLTKISEIDHLFKTEHDLLFGEILVTSQVTGFRRLLWGSRQVLDETPLTLPPTDLRTTACWWVILPEAIRKLEEVNLWRNSSNNYGSGWDRIRRLVRQRDQFTCKVCGLVEANGLAHHVHHIKPFRLFTDPLEANRLDNLVTLCPACHQRAETNVLVRSGMAGLTFTLQQISPLFVMCDLLDLGATSDAQSNLADKQPAIVIYDQVPAGIGLSRKIFDLSSEIMMHAGELISSCPCADGCPSCVGPAGENGVGAKNETLALVKLIQGKFEGNDGII
jgi:DEAD/DEAH box helicase domain-containing protein